MGRFLAGMRRLVLDEAATVRQKIHTLWYQPLAARVSEGRAIDGVRVVRVLPDGLIELACERNLSRFREGDVLCLNQGNPFGEPAWMVTLEVDEETRLVVSCREPGLNWGTIAQESQDWILDEGFIDLSHWILDALDEAGDTITGRTQILPLLMDAYGLTPREREVVGEMSAGKSTAETARALFISQHTVRDHIKAILTKTGTRSRGELMSVMFQHGV